MRQKLMVAAFALAMASANSGEVEAKSGRASYHLHTGAMVTAARHEPVGSVLRVTNPQNGRSVTVRVNDRGPFAPAGRVLDLSTGAFSKIYGGLGRGHGPVTYTVVSRGGSPRNRYGRKSYRNKRR